MFLRGAYFLLVLTPVAVLTLGNKTSVEKSTFESDFDGWKVYNESFVRRSVRNLKNKKGFIPPMLDDSSRFVITPSFGSDAGIMSKDILLPSTVQSAAGVVGRERSTELEIRFTCLVLGWRRDNDPSVRMDNPRLQLLYDDLLVFNLETAIRENEERYVDNKWNQFRLFSSLKSNRTIRLTIMGSNGDGIRNIVALDNIAITTAVDNSDAEEDEPEADFKEDGEWEKIRTGMDDILDTIKNTSSSPEFCDLLSERGPCHGSWSRYSFNASTNACQKFTYGGCEGNDNKFYSKTACEEACAKPKKTEGGKMLQEWDERYWKVLYYDSSVARVLNITAMNRTSRAGASPMYRDNTVFRRPRIMHPVTLFRNANLTVRFSLKLIGSTNNFLLPFFAHTNPGFRIYVGDDLVFDYADSGKSDDEWHTYVLNLQTNSVLSFPHLSNGGGTKQIVRIESWRGMGRKGYVVLDDLSLKQNRNLEASTTSTISTSRRRTRLTSSTTTTTTATITTTTTTTLTTFAKAHSLTPGFPCMLDLDNGPCNKGRNRFYYDRAFNTCKPFTYGGCKGNANNFENEQDCSRKCVDLSTDVCLQKPKSGPCRAYIEQYFFDADRRDCFPLIYGGCGSNGNNFQTKADCRRTCFSHMAAPGDVIAKEHIPSVPRNAEDCQLPVSVGTCNSSIPMFAFSYDKGDCVNFTYSGCGGNENLFFSKQHCLKNCGPFVRNETLGGAVTACDMPRVSDTCKWLSQKSVHWYYSKIENACKADEESCMGDNPSNQFISNISCTAICVRSDNASMSLVDKVDFDLSDCLLPVAHCAPAPANSSKVVRFAYDPERTFCAPFDHHDGCRGNKNNFMSRTECLQTCFGAAKRKTEWEEEVEFEESAAVSNTTAYNVTLCEEPKSYGKCKADVERYYFDAVTEGCVTFLYSGCGGNRNRFLTLAKCRETCETKKVVAAVDKEERKARSAVVIAEAVLGAVLVLLAAAAILLGIKYYRAIKDRQNYRVFNNNNDQRGGARATTRERSNSTSSTRGPLPDAMQMAYDNPAYINPSDGFETTYEEAPVSTISRNQRMEAATN